MGSIKSYKEWEELYEANPYYSPERFRPKIAKSFDNDQKKMQICIKIAEKYYEKIQINFGKEYMKLAGKIKITLDEKDIIEVSNTQSSKKIKYSEFAQLDSIIKELLKEEGTSLEKESIKKNLGSDYKNLENKK